MCASVLVVFDFERGSTGGYFKVVDSSILSVFRIAGHFLSRGNVRFLYLCEGRGITVVMTTCSPVMFWSVILENLCREMY